MSDLLPCPNPECESTDVEGIGHCVICNVCGMVGPQGEDLPDTDRLWNLLPRRSTPEGTEANATLLRTLSRPPDERGWGCAGESCDGGCPGCRLDAIHQHVRAPAPTPPEEG